MTLISQSRSDDPLAAVGTGGRLDLTLKEFIPTPPVPISNTTLLRPRLVAPGNLGNLALAATVFPDHHMSTVAPAIDTYVWFSTENFETASTWCTGLQAIDRPDERLFFLRALVDLYHYDRALKASTVNNLSEPTQDIVPSIEYEKHVYDLEIKPLTWTTGTPRTATTAVAVLTAKTPPDQFWIADYVQRKVLRTYDPIIYAQYGTWHVEVARWE